MPNKASLKPPQRSPAAEPETLTRRAPQSVSSSWNEKTKTFRAVIAAGGGVVRRDWDGEYVEFLDPAGVELADSIPLLNAHRMFQAADVIGVAEKVERIGKRLEAVLRLSSRDEVQGIASDIREAILSGVSIGYTVSEWLETIDDAGQRTKTATRWRLHEVSIVPIAADPGAKIRGKKMPNITDNDDDEIVEVVTEKPTRAARAASEMYVRSFAQKAGLPNTWVEQQLEAGVTKAQMHEAAVDFMVEQQRDQPDINSYVTTDTVLGIRGGNGLADPAFRTEAMGEAIAVRALPGLEPSPAARQFVGLSLPEMAREHLRLSGEDVRGLTPAQVVTRSLGGLHSTSDFAHALSSAVGRVLRKTYEEAPSGLKPLARRLELADFRARTVVGLSGMSALERVGEHGEFKRGTISDSGEKIAVEPFGKIFGVTRQVLVNDDLGWVADIPRKLGVAAAQFEAKQLAALLTSNPVMGDGKPVFHADHRNLAVSGAGPSETTLSAARKAMRSQTDEAGELIGVGPRYLVVGPELETDAEKLMAQITATATDAVQPIKLAVAVEPRLSGKSWFVAADPATIDGIAYAHLANEPGPQLTFRNGFDVDGVEFKVRLDFGCAFLDWRSWFKNPGAA